MGGEVFDGEDEVPILEVVLEVALAVFFGIALENGGTFF
jgi:hypothetical protein